MYFLFTSHVLSTQNSHYAILYPHSSPVWLVLSFQRGDFSVLF